MRVRKSLCVVVIACIAAFMMFACDTKDNAVYKLENVADIHISTEATTYDFKKGIEATKDGAVTEFTVDTSAVVFGSSGTYKIVYSVGTVIEEATVFIYGKPLYVSDRDTLTYSEAQSASAASNGLTVKDSFETVLTPTITKGLTIGEMGVVEYGDYTCEYSVEDRVGNVQTYTRKVTVSDADRPVFDTIEIDLSDLENAADFTEHAVTKVLSGGVELTTTEYGFTNGFLSFKEAFILEKEIGDYTLTVLTATGYNEVTLSITDNQSATFRFSVNDMEYAPTVTLPKAEKFGHQRDITFIYTVKGADGVSCSVDDSAADVFTFEPGMETSFTVTATALRGGATEAGKKEVNIKLHDNVYAWAVDQDNMYETVSYKADYKATYMTEKKHGTDLGSTKIENIGTEATTAVVMMNFHNTADVARGAAFEFYVYNPTGIALESYIYTSSGWWETLGLQILTDRVSIPAEEGWHKVKLTLDQKFDGTFSGMSGITTDKAETHIRICKKDDWEWDKAQGNFNVYVTNIYLVKNLADYTIDDGLTGFVNRGMINTKFSLPMATCEDGRIRFEYALSNEDGVVEYDEQEMSFTPTKAGDYKWTVKTYFRDTLLSTRETEITIDRSISIVAASYYTYGADGLVTLPSATVAQTHADMTIRYSVKFGSGEAVVLDETRVFDTKSVNGDYAYTAELLGDGGAVLDTATVTLKIHGGNVMSAFGRDPASVNAGLKHNMDAGVQYNYSTEKAAPGELGSLEIDNTKHSLGELGNFSVQLIDTYKTEATLLTFYVLHEANQDMEVRLYSSNSAIVIDYWYDGNRYTSWDEFAVKGKAGWQKIEIVVGGHNVGGSLVQLGITSQSYAWPEGSPHKIYLSNIYYSTAV